MPRSNIKLASRPILSRTVLAGLLLCLILVAPGARAAPAAPQAVLAPNYAWHTFYGSNSNDFGQGIAVDGQGNIYLVGTSHAGWTGPGNIPPVHDFSGMADIVVVKLDSNGVYQWHSFFGGSNDDSGRSVAIDPSGDVVVMGVSYSSWQGPGSTAPLHAYSGENDVTLLKLTSSGQYLWHTFYGSPGEDDGSNFGIDTQGDLFIAFYSTATWMGDLSAPPIHSHTGMMDLAILKLTGDGDYGWHTFYGSSLNDHSAQIVPDNMGYLYVAGTSFDSWVGEGNAQPIHAYSGESDLVVMKLSTSGAYQWHTFYGSISEWEYTEGMVVDESGNVTIIADSVISWDGDGGTAPIRPHSAGYGYDITLLHLAMDGDYLWHAFYGSDYNETPSEIVLTHQSDFIVAAVSDHAWTGDGGAEPLHPYSGWDDMTVMKVRSNGAYAWHTFYGSPGHDYGDDDVADIALDSVGNVLVIGYSDQSWQGDGGAEPLHPYNMETDIAVLKLAGGQYFLPLLQR